MAPPTADERQTKDETGAKRGGMAWKRSAAYPRRAPAMHRHPSDGTLCTVEHASKQLVLLRVRRSQRDGQNEWRSSSGSVRSLQRRWWRSAHSLRRGLVALNIQEGSQGTISLRRAINRVQEAP